jgi:hypothetical protein
MIRIQWEVDETQRDPDVGGDTLAVTFSELLIDATISETTDISAEATEHPVEEGIDITDHIKPNLLSMQLECIVTNTPAYARLIEGAEWATNELILPNQRSGVGARVLTFPTPIDRPVEVVDKLQELIMKGIRVDILDLRLGDVEGWLLIAMSPEVNRTDSVRFLLTARQIRTAITEEVEAPSPRVERARRNQDRGRQNGSGENDTERNRVDASTLRNLADRALPMLLPGGS